MRFAGATIRTRRRRIAWISWNASDTMSTRFACFLWAIAVFIICMRIIRVSICEIELRVDYVCIRESRASIMSQYKCLWAFVCAHFGSISDSLVFNTQCIHLAFCIFRIYFLCKRTHIAHRSSSSWWAAPLCRSIRSIAIISFAICTTRCRGTRATRSQRRCVCEFLCWI